MNSLKVLCEAIEREIHEAMVFSNTNASVLSNFIVHPVQKQDLFSIRIKYGLGIGLNKNLIKPSEGGFLSFGNNPIEDIIRKDNVIELSNLITQGKININEVIDIMSDGQHNIVSRSLIELSAECNSKNCFQLLFDMNANIKRRHLSHEIDEEWGIMEYGATNGNMNIIQMAESKGEKINELTLEAAYLSHQNEILKLLCEKMLQNGYDFSNSFWRCYHIDNLEGMSIFIKYGCNLKTLNYDLL